MIRIRREEEKEVFSLTAVLTAVIYLQKKKIQKKTRKKIDDGDLSLAKILVKNNKKIPQESNSRKKIEEKILIPGI